MRISDQIHTAVHNFLDLLRGNRDLNERMATGSATAEELRALFDEYQKSYGAPPQWLTPPAWRNDQNQAHSPQDIGALIVAGATYLAGLPLALYGAASIGMELRQDLRMQLSVSQVLLNRLVLSVGDKYQMLYAGARKIHFKDDKLGLDFEVALVSRAEAPEFKDLGAGFMIDGMSFVVEDYFVDLDEITRSAFITLVAVHEYGERVFRDHHKATQLELAVARHMGMLDNYIEFLGSRELVKFRDVVLYRLKDMVEEQLKEGGIKVDNDAFRNGAVHENDASAMAAAEIIRRFQIPQEIIDRYEGVDNEELGVVEEKVGEWIKYITALEQTEAFYNRAVEDVKWAVSRAVDEDGADAKSVQLAIRLALFRILGVMQSEIDDGILDMSQLGEELQGRLLQTFLENLKGAVSVEVGSRAFAESVLSDPIFSLNAETRTKMAKADYGIWQALGLDLKLVEDGDDRSTEDEESSDAEETRANQAVIEAARRNAWTAAMGAGASLEDQGRVLKAYSEILKEYQELKRYVNDGLESIKTKQYEVAGRYVDVHDFAYGLSIQIRRTVSDFINKSRENNVGRFGDFDEERANLMAGLIQAQVDAALPEIWKAQSRTAGLHVAFDKVRAELQVDARQLFLEFCPVSLEGEPPEVVGRLRYLNSHYSGAGPAKMAEVFDAVWDTWGYNRGEPRNIPPFIQWISNLAKDAVVSEVFAINIIKGLLECADAPSFSDRYLLAVFLEQIDDGSLDGVIIRQRSFVIRQLQRITNGEPQLLIKAALASEAFWAIIERTYIGCIKSVFNVLKKSAHVLGGFPQFLEGETPESIWQKLNMEEVFRNALTADKIEEDGVLDMLSRFSDMGFPYGAAPAEIGWNHLARLLASEERSWNVVGRELNLSLLRFTKRLLLHVDTHPEFLALTQHYVDIDAAKLRAEAVEELAKRRPEMSVEEIVQNIPQFTISVAGLINAWREVQESMEPKYEFDNLLEDVEALFGSANERKKLIGKLQLVDIIAKHLATPDVQELAAGLHYSKAQLDEARLMSQERLGYDRYTGWNTFDRWEAISRFNNEEPGYDWIRDRSHKELMRGYHKAIEHYAGLSDLSSDEINGELKTMVGDIFYFDLIRSDRIGQWFFTNTDVWRAARLYLKSAIQRGERFERVRDAFDYMARDVAESELFKSARFDRNMRHVIKILMRDYGGGGSSGSAQTPSGSPPAPQSPPPSTPSGSAAPAQVATDSVPETAVVAAQAVSDIIYVNQFPADALNYMAVPTNAMPISAPVLSGAAFMSPALTMGPMMMPAVML